jgi:4-amino-4-deoxy-L-arabinose transferase-like glycosyltransferase
VRGRLLLLTPVVLAAVLYLPCAAGRAVLDVDEALYVHAAQGMLRRHDFVTPYVNGVRFLDKPPLLYWLLASTYRMLGTTEFAAHLPPALFVIATAWLLTRLGASLAGEWAGFGAGLGFAFSTGTYLFTRETLHDGPMVFFQVLAISAFVRWYRDPGRPTIRVLVYAGALAGGVLAKGLVGLVLPLAIPLVYVLLSRERPRLRLMPALLGGALFLLLAAPWHIAASLANPGFLRHYLLNEQILRFFNRREPADFASVPLPWFLLLVLVWLFPWTPFLATLGARRGGASGADPGRGAVVRLGLVWTGVVLAFFSLSARLEHYAFPLLPPLALLAATGLSDPEGEARRAWVFRVLAVLGLVLILLGAALAFGLGGRATGMLAPRAPASLHAWATDFGPLLGLPGPVLAELLTPAAATAGALGVGFLGAWHYASRGDRFRPPLALAGAMIAFGYLAHRSLGICEDVISSKRFGLAAGKVGRGGDHLVVDGDYETANSMNFYQPLLLEIVEGSAPTLEDGLRYPDAPRLLLSLRELQSGWGSGEGYCLLAPEERLPGLGLLPLHVVESGGGRTLACNRPRS